jgi:hypothetical protein
MAKRGGWKRFIPSIETTVKVFVALVGIKVVLSVVGSTIGAKIPASVSQWIPTV